MVHYWGMRKKVFIAVNTAGPAGRGKLAGIFRYLNGRPDWAMTIVRHPAAFTTSLVRKAVSNDCDGFILSIGEADAARHLVAGLEVPTVLMDTPDDVLWHKRTNVFFIENSAEHIGAAAADYLMGTGRCRSYAYVHFHLDDRVYNWDCQRFLAFRDRIVGKGHVCHDLQFPDGIRTLERPIGILAANDEVAFSTIQFCKAHRIRVPESVLVVGVDNDTLICENCIPQITSIQPDFEREGFLAAEALEDMMSGEWRRPRHEGISVGVECIMRRDSTAVTSHAGKMIQKALAYIRANALHGIYVPDVVRTMGCSRRLADLRFRELQGMSIGQAIINARLDEVRRRLLTDASIEAIAAACGYANLSHLKQLFLRRFGVTMRDFRAKQRPKDSVRPLSHTSPSADRQSHFFDRPSIARPVASLHSSSNF